MNKKQIKQIANECAKNGYLDGQECKQYAKEYIKRRKEGGEASVPEFLLAQGALTEQQAQKVQARGETTGNRPPPSASDSSQAVRKTEMDQDRSEGRNKRENIERQGAPETESKPGGPSGDKVTPPSSRAPSSQQQSTGPGPSDDGPRQRRRRKRGGEDGNVEGPERIAERGRTGSGTSMMSILFIFGGLAALISGGAWYMYSGGGEGATVTKTEQQEKEKTKPSEEVEGKEVKRTGEGENVSDERETDGEEAIQGADSSNGTDAGASSGSPYPPRDTATAAEEIAAWAKIKKANGPAGRPLPLTASWVPEKMFGMKRMVEMIKDGHHVLPTIPDPKFSATYHYILQDRDGPPTPDSHHLGWLPELQPEFEYLAENRLPFALMGNNWVGGITKLEKQYQRDANKHNRREFTPEESARLMVKRDGKIKSGSWKMASPFAPDESWKRFARWWMGNRAIQWVQKTYPDPPMVVWLNNNEAGEIGLKHLDRSLRFQRTHGDKDLSKKEKKRILHRAYDHKYRVLFETALETLDKPAWKKNSEFVAYNAWPHSVKGRTSERNHPAEWKRYTGTMPEFYLNDWQIYRGKTDYNYWSPQTEGLRIQSSQDVIFDLDPDHYFASIVWDGGKPSTRKSAINSMAKGMYGSGPQQRWDMHRYEGMVQFGLWAMRPRVMREFRWPVSEEDAYDRAAFMTVVRSVDRPWNHKLLREFWRFGELVGNNAFVPKDKKFRNNLKRYSRLDTLLPVDVNRSRKKWPRIWRFKAGKSQPVKLRVLALALKLGEAPDRRWLVYAHAPLGGVSGPKVTIPDYQQVKLPHVAKSGSFFLVEEGNDTVKTILPGGPAEINLEVSSRFADTGDTIDVEATVAVQPDDTFTSFEWFLGDGKTHSTDKLEKLETRVTRPGLQMIRVTGITAGGEKVVAETPVFVGKKPDDAVVYDIELSDGSSWRGSWGSNGSDLLKYRMVPNPGKAPDIVLHGGSFVMDEDLGRRVLEISRDHQGLWGVRSNLTSNHSQGHPSFTVSLRFKAESLEGTQPLYVQGGVGKGFNIYLHDETLYAGSMTGKRDWGKYGSEKMGNGHWISTDNVEAGRWHQVTLVLKDATKSVEPGKLSLYLDGEKVGSAPGVRIPNHHAAPRVGTVRKTTLHTGKNISGVSFRGRIAEFQQINATRPPK